MNKKKTPEPKIPFLKLKIGKTKKRNRKNDSNKKSAIKWKSSFRALMDNAVKIL